MRQWLSSTSLVVLRGRVHRVVDGGDVSLRAKLVILFTVIIALFHSSN